MYNAILIPVLNLHFKLMNMEEASLTSAKKNGTTKTILITGLIAGSLDLTTAMIVYRANPAGMLRGIASGAFGNDAFTAGGWIVLMGLFFHYFIAASWTTLYFLSYPKIKLLQKNKYASGLLYGIVIWFVMNRMVLPLTYIKGPATFQIDRALLGMSVLVLMIGLPIAILTHRHYAGRQPHS
jgi:hypothetical protein